MKIRQFEKFVKVLINGGKINKKNLKVVSKLNSEQLTKLVAICLENNKELLKGYFSMMMKQRMWNDTTKPAGSFIKDLTEEQAEALLKSLEWEVETLDIKNGKIILKSVTPIKHDMRLGIVPIDSLPADTILKGLNPKDDPTKPLEDRPKSEVGYIVDEENLSTLPKADFIRIIIVTHQDEQRLFVVTWFPEIENSYPMKPSQITAVDLPHGKNLKINEAKSLNFEYVKIATTDQF